MNTIETVMVTIHSRQHIPLVRMLGPILQPISMSLSTYQTLKSMGIDIRIHEKTDVKVNSKTGVRELVNEADFTRAPKGTTVQPNTEYPEPALQPTEVTAPVVTEPTELASSNEPAPVTETVEHDEAETQEETQEEADQEGTAVEPTPDVEDESTLTAEEEAALEAPEEVEVETTEDESLPVYTREPVEPVVEEADQEGTAVEPTPEPVEPVVEEEQEDESLPVYTREVYATWNRAQLVSYLNGAEEYLPTAVYASLGRVNKNILLAIVEKHILPLVDSNEE